MNKYRVFLAIFALLLASIIHSGSEGRCYAQEGAGMKKEGETGLRAHTLGAAAGAPSLSATLTPAGQVSTLLDVVEITYPGNPEMTSGARHVVLLAKPTIKEKDGWYIWRDADGLWNIVDHGKTDGSISGRITSNDGIVEIVSADAAMNAVVIGENILEVSGQGIGDGEGTRFNARGRTVRFDLTTGSGEGSHSMFLGASSVIVLAVPFELENKAVGERVWGDGQRNSMSPVQNAAEGSRSGQSSPVGGGGSSSPK